MVTARPFPAQLLRRSGNGASKPGSVTLTALKPRLGDPHRAGGLGRQDGLRQLRIMGLTLKICWVIPNCSIKLATRWSRATFVWRG